MNPEQYKILRAKLDLMSDEQQADTLRAMSDADFIGLLNYMYLN